MSVLTILHGTVNRTDNLKCRVKPLVPFTLNSFISKLKAQWRAGGIIITGEHVAKLWEVRLRTSSVDPAQDATKQPG